MVSSIFDSGYYSSIKVIDLDSNAVLVERHAEPDTGGVPGCNLEEARSGYLLLLRVQDLAGLNARLGGQRTDQLLQAVGEQLLRTCANYPETNDLITRSRGGEFAVLAPGMVHDEAIQLAQALEGTLQSLHETGASDVDPVACIGLAPFSPGDAPQGLLKLADEALARAESQPAPGWRFGGRFSMIGNLAHLGLAYLKIDGGYIRNIDQERHKRLFIEAIQRAAHSIDLPLIAERVETEGELKVLRDMGVQGIQGQLVGGPAPWR
ncbi:hypothetical protein WR25_03671 [Diploscapter pachys]|uniref:GGDEF domain-containing protein n=1 Tax=Diploscapter pachys TaxID=2018661 RepID=A0A2A2KFA4_9BILA|nr:hypothetical protein WR25_03671 [Diploscapter pachys]